MASPPDAALTDYERLREENIRRNDAILASLRRKASELSAAIQSSCSSKRPKKQPPPPGATPIPVVLRRSLRTRGLPPSTSSSSAAASPPAPESPPEAPRSTRLSSSLASAILAAASASPAAPPPVRDDGFDAGAELVLRPSHVRRVMPDRILSVRVLPLVDRTVVAAGNKLGNVGFWDVDGGAAAGEEDGDGAGGVFEYLPHRGPVGAIVSHPATPQKVIYSCCYEGEICLMDLEKENFNMIYLADYPIFSLCQAPNSPSSLYLAEGNDLKHFDERMGKVSATWNSHDNRINSIDFHPENTYMLATSSTDGTAGMWDLRNMKEKKPESLKVLEHGKSVQSAYFSPSGRMVATTRITILIQTKIISDE
uniref:Uncharacterized protein n=1 Tax=Oryza meridionalis TaxID=40149 RepID=A0A0E0EJT6_9ORYZ